MNGVVVDRVKSMLRRWEGLRLSPYRCPAGRKTIGWGWNIDARGLPEFIDFYLAQHGEITEEMAEWLLDRSVHDSVEEARSLVSPEVWQRIGVVRREVLAQMVFQLGVDGARKFRGMLGCLESGDYEGAADHMRRSLWGKQTPERVMVLADMMESGDA